MIVIAIVLVVIVVLIVRVRRYRLTGSALRAVREPGVHGTVGGRSYRQRSSMRRYG